MKATIVTDEGKGMVGTQVFEVTGPDIAVQGGMFGIEYVVDGKKVYLYLPIKSLIKIEIHE